LFTKALALVQTFTILYNLRKKGLSMQEENYSIDTILAAVSKTTSKGVKKRLIFDQTLLNGIGAKWIIAFFISLPLMLFAGIFNDTMFAMLGIAQAIIFFIVFLSMVMILIIAVTFINNNKVLRQVSPSWEKLYPDVELRMALASGGTPYNHFFKHYSVAANDGLEGVKLEAYLSKQFVQMQEENKELYLAIQAAKNR
jgi:hypothetical protein